MGSVQADRNQGAREPDEQSVGRVVEELPDRPRLFFLGAGFSRPAGLPIAAELLDLVLDEVSGLGRGDSHLHRAVREYLEYVEATTGAVPDPIDIEEFATYLDHQHVFGMLGSDTWSEEGNRDQFLLRWGIGRVLHRRTPRADVLPDLYVEFAARLKPRDLVVTFNYDLLLESALTAVARPYRRFTDRYSEINPSFSTIDDDAEAEEVLIVKVHGSIDWVSRAPFDRHIDYMREVSGEEGVTFSRRRGLVFGSDACTRTRPLVEGPRPDGDPLVPIQVIEDLDSYYDTFLAAFHHPPIVLAPSQAKQLYGAALREFWKGMPLFAWAWGGFSIIGYSLPPADPYAKQVLYRIARGYTLGLEDPGWRLGPMSRILLVDHRRGAGETSALLESYRFLDRQHTDIELSGFDEDDLGPLFPGRSPDYGAGVRAGE
jgi:hypothetical protein